MLRIMDSTLWSFIKITLRREMQEMSSYEKQIQATGQYYDREMRKIEQGGSEILSSVVPGSNLHQKIHNPITEGIDEG